MFLCLGVRSCTCTLCSFNWPSCTISSAVDFHCWRHVRWNSAIRSDAQCIDVNFTCFFHSSFRKVFVFALSVFAQISFFALEIVRSAWPCVTVETCNISAYCLLIFMNASLFFSCFRNQHLNKLNWFINYENAAKQSLLWRSTSIMNCEWFQT